MLRHFGHLYTDAVRLEAMRRFGLNADDAVVVSGASHSFVYDCGRVVLKVTHTSHRSAANVLGELEFVNYLADGGIAAPRAVRSRSGNFVEVIDGTETQEGDSGEGDAVGEQKFIAAAYDKAEGALMDWRFWSPALYEEWGALIGRMHALTKGFAPSEPTLRRRSWHQDRDWDLDNAVYRRHPALGRKARRIRQWLQSLPMAADSYGLIHSDLHQWNFFVHPLQHAQAVCENAPNKPHMSSSPTGGQGKPVIMPFDFDNTHYDWFLSDFTTVIVNVTACQQHHYARGEYDYWASGRAMDAAEFLDYFMTAFMAGYHRHNALGSEWMRRLPAFLNRHWLTFYTDALWDTGFVAMSEEEQAAEFPWRTLRQLRDEVMGDYWSRFSFDKFV